MIQATLLSYRRGPLYTAFNSHACLWTRSWTTHRVCSVNHLHRVIDLQLRPAYYSAQIEIQMLFRNGVNSHHEA